MIALQPRQIWGAWADTGLSLDYIGNGWVSQGFAGLRTYDDRSQSHGLISASLASATTGPRFFYEARIPTNSRQGQAHDFTAQTPLGAGPGAWVLGLGYALEDGDQT